MHDAVDLTAAKGHDSKSVQPMLAQLHPALEIEQVIGDGGYDTWDVYDAIQARAPNAKVIIPPTEECQDQTAWQQQVTAVTTG
ncbi:MAG: transposase [Anaerolineales bacterium]|nr:transposase [Anaerolineales bacterium]